MVASARVKEGRAGVILRRACVGLLALALVPCMAPAALADETLAPEPGPANDGAVHAQAMAQASRCGSVVIRHCRLQQQAAHATPGAPASGREGAPMEWDAVQYAGPDSDEIVVNGRRIRDPGLKEVFDRTFGLPLQARDMRTRGMVAGARCTTVASTGATLCSNGGNTLPALENPLTDWAF